MNTDLFDPRSVMDSDFSRGPSAGEADFGFAFNDSNFSDRVLRIEIVADPAENGHDSEGCTSVADWARHRKRRREDIKKETGKYLFGFYGSLSLLKEMLCLYLSEELQLGTG